MGVSQDGDGLAQDPPSQPGASVVTNVFAVVGEHRREPWRRRLIGEDGRVYAYATDGGRPLEVEPCEAWRLEAAPEIPLGAWPCRRARRGQYEAAAGRWTRARLPVGRRASQDASRTVVADNPPYPQNPTSRGGGSGDCTSMPPVEAGPSRPPSTS